MQIYINNRKADFQERSVNIGYTSPVFQDYGGEAALEINLPITPNNKQILGYAHRLDGDLNQAQTYNVVIKFGGYEKAGTGRITSIDTKAYKMSLGFEKSDFFGKIAKKTFKDLQWAPFLTNYILHRGLQSKPVRKSYNKYYLNEYQVSQNGEPKTGLEEIKVNGLDLYSGSNDGTIDIKEDQVLLLSGKITCKHGHAKAIVARQIFANNSLSAEILTASVNNDEFNSILLPLKDGPAIQFDRTAQDQPYAKIRLYLKWKSKKQDIKTHYTVDVKLENLTVTITQTQNLRSDPYPLGEFALPSFFARNFYPEQDLLSDYFSLYPMVNHNKNNNWPSQVTFTSGDSSRAYHNIICPMPYVATVFDRIAATIGYRIDKSIFRDTAELQQLVLYNNVTENGQFKIMEGASNNLNTSEPWDMRKHLPKMELSKFILLLELFGAKLFADSQNKTISIRFLKDILEATPGFEASLPLKDFSCEPTFDNAEFSFDCGESLSGDLCIDLSDKNITDIGEDEELPAGAHNYKSLFHRDTRSSDNLPRGKEYFLYVNEAGDEGNTDMWKLCAIAANPFHKNEESENAYSVESPIGPVFSGNLFVLLNRDAAFTDESDLNGQLAVERQNMPFDGLHLTEPYTVVEDTAIISGSYQSLEDDPSIGISFARMFDDGTLRLTHEAGETTQVPCDIALRWEGANGLYEKFWREVAEWLTAPTTRKCKFTIPAMSVTDYEKMKRADKVRINQQNYIIDTLKADFADTVTNIQVEAYTCF